MIKMQSISGIIMLVVLFALMYFLMIRPQKKRQKKHAATLKQLNKGDHVVTVGRLHGVVDEIDRDNQTVTLDCDGIYLVFDLRAVASVNNGSAAGPSKSEQPQKTTESSKGTDHKKTAK